MRLAIIVPMYNEELCVGKLTKVLSGLIDEYVKEKLIDKNSYIMLVDDGSKDGTWRKVVEERKKYSNIKAIKFSKNFGNQSAIIAGYKTVQNIGCDMVVTIDADLQQDERKIKDFIKAYKEGYEIVCGVRKSYNNKFGLKSIFSSLFYSFINFMGVELKPNHSEYRLIGKKALDIINKYKERNIFVRGMVYDLGLKTKFITYKIRNRECGESKFNFVSLTKMAVGAIVSFSIRPLRIVFLTGVAICTISIVLAILMFIQMHFQTNLLSRTIKPFEIGMTLFAGIQILCTGIIGEYVGQILTEIKGRPRYIIDEEII